MWLFLFAESLCASPTKPHHSGILSVDHYGGGREAGDELPSNQPPTQKHPPTGTPISGCSTDFPLKSYELGFFKNENTIVVGGSNTGNRYQPIWSLLVPDVLVSCDKPLTSALVFLELEFYTTNFHDVSRLQLGIPSEWVIQPVARCDSGKGFSIRIEVKCMHRQVGRSLGSVVILDTTVFHPEY